ncbi:hypothetical protein BH10BAC6_BH10BAC6_00800 [soil metagenome]
MKHLYTTLLLAAFLTFPVNAQDCTNLPWEAQFTYDLNHIQSDALHTASGVVSDALLPLTIGVPVAMYAGGFATKDRYMSETGLQTAVTVGVTYGITLVMKHVFDRPRPYEAYPGCIVNYREDSDGSFPSGHSAGSAALATSLCLRYPQWYVIVPSVAYALYTGFARMNLGMHYVSDVLTGYAIGAGVAILVNALNEKIFNAADPILPTATSSGMGVIMLPGHVPVFAMSIPF